MNEDKIKAEIAAMSDEQKRQLKADLTDLRHVALDLAHEAMAERSAEFDKRLAEARGETSTRDERIAARPAPKVTPADIEAEIASEHYFTAAEGVHGRVIDARRRQVPDAPLVHTFRPVDEQDADEKSQETTALGLLTFCVLILRNGFTVTGESACASPANFDAEIGRKVARQAAVAKMWPLLGFRLRDRLSGVHYRQCVWDEDDRISAEAKQAEPSEEFEILGEEVVDDPNDFGQLFRMAVQRDGKTKYAVCAFCEFAKFGPKTKEEARAKCIADLRKAYADNDRQQDA